MDERDDEGGWGDKICLSACLGDWVIIISTGDLPSIEREEETPMRETKALYTREACVIGRDAYDLRKHLPSQYLYHHAGGVNTRKKHQRNCGDAYDHAKVLSMMARRIPKKAKGRVPSKRYKIVVNNTEYIVKQAHLLDRCNKLTSQGVDFKVEIVD